MSQTVSLVFSPRTHDDLEAIVADRRRPLTHALRARIVLLRYENSSMLEKAESDAARSGWDRLGFVTAVHAK